MDRLVFIREYDAKVNEIELDYSLKLATIQDEIAALVKWRDKQRQQAWLDWQEKEKEAQ